MSASPPTSDIWLQLSELTLRAITGSRARSPVAYEASSAKRAFASFRSRVSNPSVNHPYTGASSSRACCTLPWSRQSRAMLIGVAAFIGDCENTRVASKS